MRVGITYNLKDELPFNVSLDSEFFEEFDTRETVEAISAILVKKGHEVVKLGARVDIVERIKKEKIRFVFNLAEGYSGRNRESHIPCILEMLNVPYSGSDPLSLGLSLDKTLSKKIAQLAGIPTPSYRVVKIGQDLKDVDAGLAYPLITKPSWEGSSKGIYNSSKVSNKTELEKNILFLFEKYPDQPVLVEEYIQGREVTAGIIGNTTPRLLGLMEIVNRNNTDDFFYSLEVKRNWRKLVDYKTDSNIIKILEGQLCDYAMAAFKEFGCRDIARIDFKISWDNKIFFLEINPLPGLSPEYSDLVIMTQKLGIAYKDFISEILHQGLSRYNLVDRNSLLCRDSLICQRKRL